MPVGIIIIAKLLWGGHGIFSLHAIKLSCRTLSSLLRNKSASDDNIYMQTRSPPWSFTLLLPLPLLGSSSLPSDPSTHHPQSVPSRPGGPQRWVLYYKVYFLHWVLHPSKGWLTVGLSSLEMRENLQCTKSHKLLDTNVNEKSTFLIRSYLKIMFQGFSSYS